MMRLVVFICLLASCLGGLTRFGPKGRIMGGTNVDIEDYPYQLSLGNSGHYCGAAIIGEYWALTTASCLSGQNLLNVLVRAGSSIRGSGTIHAVDVAYLHEQFNSATIDHDIAAIKVATPFDLEGGLLKAIPMAEATPEPGTVLTLTGWGQTGSSGASSTLLQLVQLPVVTQASCRGAYGWWISITDNMMCGKSADGSKAPCMGDYGGPVVADGELVGLVSFVMGCGLLNYPEVNVDVASEREWIREKTGI